MTFTSIIKKMCRVEILIYVAMICVTSLVQAQKTPIFFQVDLILFRQENTSSTNPLTKAIILPSTSKAVALQPANGSEAPYRLLPLSYSLLKSQYLNLKHSPNYQIIGRYTWRQPLNSQKSVILPQTNLTGWNIEGLLQVKRSNYHYFQAELSLASPDQQITFHLKQKQRLKQDQIYFLDETQAGILIKIHPL